MTGRVEGKVAMKRLVEVAPATPHRKPAVGSGCRMPGQRMGQRRGNIGGQLPHRRCFVEYAGLSGLVVRAVARFIADQTGELHLRVHNFAVSAGDLSPAH